jgi:hypothetical protein
MPLIQIDLDRELYDEKHELISSEIHQAQIEALNIPVGDKYQIFVPHDKSELKFDPTYGGVDRLSLIVIQITMVHLYSVRTKAALYRAIITRLADLGIRPEDVLISVVENGYEDWHAGPVTQNSP